MKESLEELIQQLPEIEKQAEDNALDDLKKSSKPDEYVYTAYKRIEYSWMIKNILRMYIVQLNKEEKLLRYAIKQYEKKPAEEIN
jgi:hypothetical protein